MATKVERLKSYYEATPQMCTDAMLVNLVELGSITAADYQTITGNSYVADYAQKGGEWSTSTSAVMSAANPILPNRHLIIETDTGKMKIGDGVTNYNDIDYIPSPGGLALPPNDGATYVVKNGAYVPVAGLTEYTELAPEITAGQSITIGVNQAMTNYQITGKRITVGDTVTGQE